MPPSIVKNLHHLALLPVLLLAACASHTASQKSPAAAESGRKKLSDRMTENNGYKQDADGNWKPQVDKRSEYESKGDNKNYKKDYAKQTYKAGDYAKKSWWGNKDYARRSYKTESDGSSFQKTSSLQTQNAREAGNNASVPSSYRTGSYATGSAHESGSAPVKNGTNSSTEDRQRVYQQPEIIDWKEQRGLSMEQSKGLLGN